MISYLIRCTDITDAKRLFYKAYRHYGTINAMAKCSWSSNGYGEIRLKNDEADYLFIDMSESHTRGTWRTTLSGSEFEKILDDHINRVHSIADTYIRSIGVKIVPVEE